MHCPRKCEGLQEASSVMIKPMAHISPCLLLYWCRWMRHSVNNGMSGDENLGRILHGSSPNSSSSPCLPSCSTQHRQPCLQARRSGNGGKPKQLTPPYCMAKSPIPLWAGCSTASAPSGAGGDEMSRIGVDVTSQGVLHTMSCLSCSLGCTLTRVYAQWEVIENPTGGPHESYPLLLRTKQYTSLLPF